MQEIQGFTHVIVPKESQEKEAARLGSPPAEVADPKPERYSEKFAKLAGRPKDYQASTHMPLGMQHTRSPQLHASSCLQEDDTTVTIVRTLLHMPALALL